MKINKITQFVIIGLLIALPQLSLASSYVISTIKNTDPNSNNLSWFRYNEEAGKTIKDTLVLKNLGTQQETVKIYATDATSNQAGSFIPLLPEDTQKGIGAWTKLDKNEVTLDPNQSAEINFQIEIPNTATPGEYFGSIIKEENNLPCYNPVPAATDSSCKGNIQIKTRTGNRVYLTIPGELTPDIRMPDFTYEIAPNGHVIFKFKFINKGNVAFQPEAIINIFDSFGNKVDTLDRSLGKSLPNTTIEPMVDWAPNAKIGAFKAKVEVYYKQDYQGSTDSLHGSPLSDHREISLFIFPWIAIYGVLALLIIISGFWIFRKNQYRNFTKHSFQYSIGEDENIIDIAEKFDVKWQVLVKMNHLKPPYIIEKNKIINVPQNKSKNQ